MDVKNVIKNYGFIPDEIKPEDYVFGGFSKIKEVGVLQRDGQWSEYLPEKEIQHNKGFDSMNCTNYGTLNCIEALLKKIYDLDVNFSERYTGVLTGTTEVGNTPHKVIEIIRKDSGLILEEMLPFTEDIDSRKKYYSPDPMTAEYLVQGSRFLGKYKIKHEWVFVSGSIQEKQEKMMDALEYSPLGVSVRAWKEKDGLYVKNKGAGDNHWTAMVGYKKGKFWIIFDSYDNTIKRLHWDYDFGFAKRYSITINTDKPTNWLLDLIRACLSFKKK